MKSTLFIISVSASLGAALLLIILFGIDGISFAKASSFIVFSALIGFNIYLPSMSHKTTTESGAIASVGVKVAFGFVALVVSVFAVYLTVNNKEALGLGLNIIAIVFVVFSVGFGHITAVHVDKITQGKDFRSDHILWAEQLKEISHEAEDQNLKSRLYKFSDNVNFLSRDPLGEKLIINRQISEVVANLGRTINGLTLDQADQILTELKRKFDSRETQIKSSRHQV